MADPSELEPGQSYMYIIFAGVVDNDQIPVFKERMSERVIGPVATKFAFSGQPLELFRFEDGEVRLEPEPWVTLEELHHHYVAEFLPRHPNLRPGVWPTSLFGEWAALLPEEKVVRNKKGDVEKIDRQALRELAEQEKHVQTRRLSGRQRQALTLSFGQTLQLPAETSG